MESFSSRLLQAAEATGAPACVGIDPHLDRIPREFFTAAARSHEDASDILLEGVAGFSQHLIEVLGEAGIRIVKPQIAFFEALGPHGIALYESVCAAATRNGMVVIGDVKRGDIGSTSKAYATGWLGGTEFGDWRSRAFSVDSITINPYLGSDGIEPFSEAALASGRGLFVLLKTSNASSAELQDLELKDGTLVYERMASLIAGWGNEGIDERTGYSHVGAVVGATFPEVAEKLRSEMPHTLFLVPGFGAQGAKARDLVPFFKVDDTGAIVNSSRGVIHAYGDGNFSGDWKGVVSKAATSFVSNLRRALGGQAG